MGRSRGRNKPSDPDAILQRNAAGRAAARAAERDPASWRISAELIQLPTSADVTIVRGVNEKILTANRSDPFDLLLAAGGLTAEQHRASRRLFRDWCLRAGVRDRDRGAVLERIDGGRRDPSALVTNAMVDAGRRIAAALKGDAGRGIQGIGPVNARLLEALISPMVDEGRIIAWRGVVERVTGERDRNAQGAMVRQACESLRMVYDETDELRRRIQDAKASTEVA